MKSTKRKKPIYKDLDEGMSAICTVSNVWGYCLSWRFENPKLFNKFMELCAFYKGDDSYLSQKMKETEFMYHKGLKRDVLIAPKMPNGFTKFLDPYTYMWVKADSTELALSREKH